MDIERYEADRSRDASEEVSRDMMRDAEAMKPGHGAGMAIRRKTPVWPVVVIIVLVCGVIALVTWGVSALIGSWTGEQRVISNVPEERVDGGDSRAEVPPESSDGEPITKPEEPVPEPGPDPAAGDVPEKPNIVESPSVPPTSGERIAYLSFDDGPSQYTTGILAILQQYGAKATFFVTGRSDHLYKDIVAGGHAIGLHSNGHRYEHIYVGEQAFFDDLAALSARVEAQVGYAPKIMRFPGGSSNTVSRRYNVGIMSRLSGYVHDRGYKYYDWNCATGDGGAGVTVGQEIAQVAACGQDVLYILAHDTVPQTLEAMRTIVPALINRGYKLLPITVNTPEYHHRINN